MSECNKTEERSVLKDTVLALYRMGYPKESISFALGLNDPRIEKWVEEYERQKTQQPEKG